MSCETSCCGTGIFNVPRPADANSAIGFLGIARYGSILLSWNHPTVLAGGESEVTVYYSNQSYFELAQVLAVTSNSSTIFNATGDRALKVWYFWLENFVVGGEVQPIIGPIAVEAKAASIADAIQQLSDELENSDATILLKSEIANLSAQVVGQGVISQETHDAAAGTLSLMEGILQKTEEALAAALEYKSTLISDTQALATSISQVEAAYAAVAGTVETQSTAIADIEEGLSMSWSMKMQGQNSAGEPIIGGLGMTYGERTDTVDFAILADRFWIDTAKIPAGTALPEPDANGNYPVLPDVDYDNPSQRKVKPFMVDSDGKVYIDQAIIGRASIESAQITSLMVDKIFSWDNKQIFHSEETPPGSGNYRTYLKSDFMITGALESKNYNQANKVGWKLDYDNDTFEIFGNSGGAGYMIINSNGIKIYDSKAAGALPAIELSV